MNKSNNIQNDINFLFEMGNLRFIRRMWNRFLNDESANLADHHFRAFWIAMTIAAREGGDNGKIAKMVLIHDIPESRTGDVDYLARQYTERNEKLALQDMLGGTDLADEFYDLWQEYEAHESLEAKIAKDADNLDVDFELAEQAARGNCLRDAWQTRREFVAKEKLYTKTAKELFDGLQTANPHAWHLNGRNRLNAGDWQKNTSTHR